MSIKILINSPYLRVGGWWKDRRSTLPAFRSSCFLTPQDGDFLPYGKRYVKEITE
jgi:hypothetical protein